MQRVYGLAQRALTQIRFLRYFLVSLFALAVDVGAFLTLLEMATPAAAASALGYSLGIAAHWILSSRFVFGDAVQKTSRKKGQQMTLFVLSALIGLALSTGIVGIAVWVGFDPRLAKLVAVGVSFVITYLLRSRIVFRPNRSIAA